MYDAGKIAKVKLEDLDHVTKLTWHSARVTLLDMAVHQGRSTEEIGLEVNWKNPGPLVLKYNRSRSTVPATMIKELLSEFRISFSPKYVRKDDDVDDGEDQEESL